MDICQNLRIFYGPVMVTKFDLELSCDVLQGLYIQTDLARLSQSDPSQDRAQTQNSNIG